MSTAAGVASAHSPVGLAGRNCFAWGCLGAVIPEVLRFFQILRAGEALPDLNWLLYPIVALSWALCAGAVSVAWKPDASWQAMWIGMSCPAIVASLIQAAPSLPS